MSVSGEVTFGLAGIMAAALSGVGLGFVLGQRCGLKRRPPAAKQDMPVFVSEVTTTGPTCRCGSGPSWDYCRCNT